MPNRTQIELRPMDLESLLPEGHRARLVWAWVERQDLSAMYSAIKVRQGGVGRSAIAPQILLGLWLYASLQGVGSARQLSRLVLEHDAYRWMSGGVQVNHHSLSDFRVAHGAALDELLSASLAALMTAGAVKLECVAQDGVRVRASAGAASFRRKASLQDNLELARARVRELKEQIDADPAQDSRRKAAAQQRARREMQQRLQSALDRLPELEAIKRRNGSKAEEARASSTDADATVMKMADGGFRPAYNAQYASDCDSQVIVGVEVSTSGSDMAQLAPMVEQIEQRLGSAPQKMLVDGGFPAHAQIDAVADKTEVYAPVPEARAKKDEQGQEVQQDRQDKHEPKPDDSAAVASWRQRMASDEAKELYKRRAATAECVNAQARNRGLQRMPVRGLKKVRCVALLFALAHNLMRTLALAPQLLGLGTTPSAAGMGTV
ncbi:MAG: IS1182 family transposase [Betaproteobacteria bacterium]|jgi:transposase|nr:IS1182 family transposase [Betaproteobacteria bacterium]HRB11316.1 IS1182 family transposase [Ottowia sp.]MBK7275629.1 IS1182 family transposase [Betaproteobacteria bacterium]MBK7459882.1 IS1182 family transposase [Betaproteobacteria bacterium]MBK7515316.1 IS1182 family transposase [Betaproteobacteria bacterium]